MDFRPVMDMITEEALAVGIVPKEIKVTISRQPGKPFGYYYIGIDYHDLYIEFNADEFNRRRLNNELQTMKENSHGRR